MGTSRRHIFSTCVSLNSTHALCILVLNLVDGAYRKPTIYHLSVSCFKVKFKKIMSLLAGLWCL